MIRFNANLYRIAMLASSKEETRYYLNGAFIEPHPVKGVTLVTTDGRKLLAIYDENGAADESAIVRLTPEAMKACKPGKGERRDITIATGSASATVNVTTEAQEGIDEKGRPCGAVVLTDTPVAISANCKIDGTFPDYRRVLPPPAVFDAKSFAPAFSPLVVDTFCKVSTELAEHYGASVAPFRMNANSEGPTLVTFPPNFNAFGVALPMRSACEAVAPAWFGDARHVPAALAEAAE